MATENNLTVVIRSVHERTESACYNLILEQGISSSDIFIIHETPFSSALQKAYSIGIEKGKKWTLCVDADVLLRSGIISQMLQLADKMPEHVFETQGMIWDYLFGGPKEGGIHLYRTSLLPKALHFTSEAGFQARPENYILLRMKAEGHPFQRLNLVVGLHDFDQFYKDIFRKCFIHAYKHTKYISLLLPYWKTMVEHSEDFKIARLGLIAGMEHRDLTFQIDANNKEIERLFLELGIIEKSSLKTIWTTDIVDTIVNTRSISNGFYQYFERDPDYFYDIEKRRALKSIQRSLRSVPFFLKPIWIIGKVFLSIGRKIVFISEK